MQAVFLRQLGAHLLALAEVFNPTIHNNHVVRRMMQVTCDRPACRNEPRLSSKLVQMTGRRICA